MLKEKQPGSAGADKHSYNHFYAKCGGHADGGAMDKNIHAHNYSHVYRHDHAYTRQYVAGGAAWRVIP
jgi:hypothetical protein